MPHLTADGAGLLAINIPDGLLTAVMAAVVVLVDAVLSSPAHSFSDLLS